MTMLVTTDYATRYAEWLARARPLLQERRWKEAFTGYPYARYDDAPWATPRRPLSACVVAPITSGGLYLPASQSPFDEPNPEGDVTYRVLPTTLSQRDIAVAHGHYDPTSALNDFNCVYPVDRLRELADAGVIGGVAHEGYSFMGYATNAAAFQHTTAQAIAERVVASGADAALLVPV